MLCHHHLERLAWRKRKSGSFTWTLEGKVSCGQDSPGLLYPPISPHPEAQVMAQTGADYDFPRKLSMPTPTALLADGRPPLPDLAPVLQLVSNARATYGLRHQDYARYKYAEIAPTPRDER